ncbi:MAG: isoleucine--tRNA ligase, partial [Muribaculaceae bacterium]|nr:isoleucine--tRNA ligase [Muribaculaceae bacterium]
GSPVVTLEDVEIIPEDIPGWLVANDGNVTVALDITVTPALKNEGMARELINRIQNIRKSSDFDITDKVIVELSPSQNVTDALSQFGEYIATQVLADEITLSELKPSNDTVELDIDGEKILARVTRK